MHSARSLLTSHTCRVSQMRDKLSGGCPEREITMPCEPDELKHVPLFELLDDEELAVLAAQVDLKRFAPRQRIFKIGDPSRQAYVVLSGSVRVTTVDEDQQEVLVDEPGQGELLRIRLNARRDPASDECDGVRRTLFASSSTAMTLPSCCSASPWRVSIC